MRPLPYSVKAELEQALSYIDKHASDVSAKDVAAARAMVKTGQISFETLQACAVYWKSHSETRSVTSLLHGGASGQRFFGEVWRDYTLRQEKSLLERHMAMAKTNMRSSRHALYALTPHALESFSKHQPLAFDDSFNFEEQASERDVLETTVIVPLKGVLMAEPGWMDLIFGASSLSLFAERMKLYSEDDTVKEIIIKSATCGGEVLGLSKAIEAVREAVKKKPVRTYVESACCSAGYWICSQTNSVSAAELSQIGSIGVIAPLEDVSKQESDEGRKHIYVRSGENKALGQYGEAVDEKVVQDKQRQVDDLFAVFLSDISKGRKQNLEEVKSRYGNGATYAATQALELGLIDKIETLENMVKGEQS